MAEQDARLAEEIRRLYWESDLSVKKITERLDITSATLYDALEPAPAGARCTACGGAMTYRNRTARVNGDMTCAGCGRERREDGSERTTSRAGDASDAADPDWVSDAVEDALESTEKVFRDVLLVTVGIVAVLAVGVVGLLSRQRRG